MLLAGISAAMSDRPELLPTSAGFDIYQDNMPLVDAEVPRAFATMALVSTAIFCHARGRPLTPCRNGAGIAENVLRMAGLIQDDLSGRGDVAKVKQMDQCFTLFAEHGMAVTTTSFLLAGSTHGDPLSSLVAALAAANGPLHGGAQEIGLRKLQSLKDPQSIATLLDNVKARRETLFGFGHRIYQTPDPRGIAVHKMLDEIKEYDNLGPSLATLMEIDRIVNTDDYFVSRNIKANGDLYVSMILTNMGIPAEFVMIFLMIARSVSCLAHWREHMSE